MSPAVCGFGRPDILIPRNLAESLSVTQLRAVFLHELAHVKRGDVWVNHAQTLVQIFYWWHPLLWLANSHIRRVREHAVDETVRVQMGAGGESYPSTLIEVAKLNLRRPLPALGLIGIVESRSALAQRIKHLLDSPAPQTAKLRMASLIAIILIGALLLPMAKGQLREGNKTTGQSYGLEAGNVSNPTRPGAGVAPVPNLVITLVKREPYIYLGSRAVTFDQLKEELERVTAGNPNAALSIRADSSAAPQEILDVIREAAISAQLKRLKVAQYNRARVEPIEVRIQSQIETQPAQSIIDKAATNQIVMIDAMFIAVPNPAGAEKRNAPSDPTLLVSKGENPSPFLDADSLKAVLAAYASQGIQPFAAPSVTVIAGNEAELSVSKAEVQDGKAILVGAALGVAPNVNGNSVVLRLRLRLGNLSESANPSASFPPSDLFDSSSQFVLSTNVTVPDGKSAILGSPSGQKSGTNYVIFVTPKLVAPDKLPGNP